MKPYSSDIIHFVHILSIAVGVPSSVATLKREMVSFGECLHLFRQIGHVTCPRDSCVFSTPNYKGAMAIFTKLGVF